MQTKSNTCSLLLLSMIPVLALFSPNHIDPVRSFHSEWTAIMLGLLAWVCALPLLWQQQTALIPRLALLPLALMAFIGIQAQLLPMVVIQHAQLAMMYLLWSALLMLLVKLLVAETSQQTVSQWIALGIVTAAICATLIEIVLRINGISGWAGGTAQENNYGDLLALGLASVLYLQDINKPEYRVYLLTLAVVIVVGLSLTPSRSVWLYWLATIVIAFLLQRPLLKWLFAWLAVYLALQALWSFNLFPTPQASLTSAEKLYQSVGGTSIRLHIWQVAWQLFTQAPLLGHGFGQFDWSYFQAAQHIPELPNRLEHAHNLILHLLAELGLFPVLIFCGLVGIWLKDVLVVIAEKRQQQNSNKLAFYTWLLMLLSVLGIHSLLEYPLWYAQFLSIAAIVLALGETQHWQLRLKSGGGIAIAVLISVGVFIASIHEWYYINLETDLNNKQQVGARLFSDAQQAILQAPLLTPYVATVFSISSHLSTQEMRPDLTILNNFAYHFLPSAPLAYQQAALQALNGDETQAQQTMKLALLAYPNSVENFLTKLTLLNPVEQQKTAFLRKMAQQKLKS